MKDLDSIEILKKNWKNAFHKQFEDVELDKKSIDAVQDIEDLNAEIWYFDDLVEDADNIIFSK